VSDLRIVRVDPLDPDHASALLALLDEYARSLEGGGKAIAADAKARLPAMLAAQPHYAGLLAYLGSEPVGLVNCFQAMSTFSARPLLNVHDIAVTAARRGRGVGRRLLAAAEALARERGCCKLTLEVLEGNVRAMGLYRDAGFAAYELDPSMGRAVFLEKRLD
jgi:ribosomal protein S18 acetylase RimI-like enzyme